MATSSETSFTVRQLPLGEKSLELISIHVSDIDTWFTRVTASIRVTVMIMISPFGNSNKICNDGFWVTCVRRLDGIAHGREDHRVADVLRRSAARDDVRLGDHERRDRLALRVLRVVQVVHAGVVRFEGRLNLRFSVLEVACLGLGELGLEAVRPDLCAAEKFGHLVFGKEDGFWNSVFKDESGRNGDWKT